MDDHSKKRPRSDYYDRLVFQCQKDLHKHAKQTKQFEVKKLIRQLKTNIPPKDQVDGDPQSSVKDNSSHQHRNKLLAKLQELKDYDVEPVVQECIRQLGLAALNPNQGSVVLLHSSSDRKEEASWILDRIVHHTRLKATMDKWHEEVTKYRRWSMVKREKEDSQKFVSRENSLFVQLGTGPSSSNKVVGKARKRTTKVDPSVATYGASYYGPMGGGGGGGDGAEVVADRKKNRKGQRARKAKALAVAAKREGRMLHPEESVNWRPKRKHESSDASSRTDRPHATRMVHKEQLQESQTSNNNETLHPSWQARKDKKNSIVAFQGKKIIF